MTPFIIGWIIAIVAFIGIEAATIQLVSIWFMGGALAGMIAAMCGLGFVWQFGLFVAVSALLLTTRGRALTLNQLHHTLQDSLDYLERKQNPITNSALRLRTPEGVRALSSSTRKSPCWSRMISMPQM